MDGLRQTEGRVLPPLVVVVVAVLDPYIISPAVLSLFPEQKQ